MGNIPQGTKFHGVAPGVETANKGSALANAQRDKYTIMWQIQQKQTLCQDLKVLFQELLLTEQV